MDITTLHAVVRLFPLVGRPRPACPSLQERVREIAEIADIAWQQGANGLHQAAHALNKAALVASDCGLGDLARDLCWQHIDVYRRIGAPLTVPHARYMLEPVLNLARLQIRAENGDQALRLLDAVYQAVTARTELVVEGQPLPTAGLIGTRQEHHKLREWAWLQYLADGIRALAMAGRWDEAVTHAKVHNGVGVHLMEGRQAEIIAHCLHGASQAARNVLEECELTEPWERQVGACLNVMSAGRSLSRDGHAMVQQFLGSEPIPGYAVFRARFGLAVATLTGAFDVCTADRVLVQVAMEALQSGDGYAARDVLGHHTVMRLAGDHRRGLTELVASAGLGSESLPAPLLDSITASVKLAREVLAKSLPATASRRAARREPPHDFPSGPARTGTT
ncbi:hypothetical protein [Nonomuraea jiangxiensis]|uniref:Uncharacterized protein n=1 Tax=Nonomuraea jiangxiensis TaxID=633440 RepID=A0A1G9LQ13_9ACTN|nr:hypothetical protein [Nonomuraea jiangxiensis]SDL63575.1 hypothetical protein SAMN05421869_12868 [Nonomuraea jiangxiensis]